MIEAEDLTRHYGARTAVDGVTFSVPRGEIVGFLGPNGAGKTTTLRMLSGFIPPSRGTARVGGHDIIEASLSARKLIGYMPESVPLHPELRVDEYLRFRAEIKGVRDIKTSLSRALELADLTAVSRRLIHELSKGNRQRVGLADALIARPPLLILDEPTEGLDPNQVLRFRDVLKGLGEEHTILLSTHILSEVEAVCSTVVIIHQGKVATAGSLSAVRAELQGGRRELDIAVSLRDKTETDFANLIAGITNTTVSAVTLTDGVLTAVLTVRADDDSATERFASACVTEGFGLRALSPRQRSLEKIFHELTTPAEPTAHTGRDSSSTEHAA